MKNAITKVYKVYKSVRTTYKSARLPILTYVAGKLDLMEKHKIKKPYQKSTVYEEWRVKHEEIETSK